MALTKAHNRMIEGAAVNVKDFGAVGDGVTDDTAAIQAAIDVCKTNGLKLRINPGVYIISDTLSMNDGYDDCVSIVGAGGFSNEPTFKFQDGVTIGLKCLNSKNTLIKDLIIDMTNVTNNCIGIFLNAFWDSRLSNVKILGPGATDPSSGQASYGLVLRPTYNGTVTSKAAMVAVEAISSANTGVNMGVYWNLFEQINIDGFGYGIAMSGAEGGSNPRTNQNQFNSCKINGNYHNINMDGIGGGNTFYSTTAENAFGDSVHIVNVSSGTGPVWIGGELSATGDKWKGPGLLLNTAAGTDFPVANAAGQNGTHMRFTDQGSQAFGQKINASFLSDYEIGTYTATCTPETSGTIPLNSAIDTLSYTKIGRQVTVTGSIVTGSPSSPVGSLVKISLPPSLPVANLTESAGRITGVCNFYNGSSWSMHTIFALEGDTQISVVIDASTIVSSNSFYLTFTYFA